MDNECKVILMLRTAQLMEIIDYDKGTSKFSDLLVTVSATPLTNKHGGYWDISKVTQMLPNKG